MDNGLIFPYRRRTAPVNPVVLRVRILSRNPSGESFRASARPHAGAASVLTGVTQEGSRAGRWLSRSKGVGRDIGKSVSHVPETRWVVLTDEIGDPMLPRKASTRGSSRPYPKPTQVVR